MRKLYFGLSGDDVKKLQMKLQSLGYATFIPTAFFGLKTHLAVREYQKAMNLPSTGVIGLTEANLLGLDDEYKKSERLYNVMLSVLNTDVTPKDQVDDDVSCAFSLDTIYKLAFGEYIAGTNVTVSTLKLKEALMQNYNFALAKKAEKGDIVVYPTGEGNFKHGHCFIVGENSKWYSNSSHNGLWQQNYTEYTADYRYVKQGNFPKYIFRLV